LKNIEKLRWMGVSHEKGKDRAGGVKIVRQEQENRHSSWLDRTEPLIFIFYCLVAGLYLLLIPWTINWEEIIFFNWSEILGRLGRNPALRGGISGIGFVLIFLGLSELLRFLKYLIQK